jgi:hypothetical protein
MLHHVEPRLFFCLMHMFVIHKFDLVACLNLNRKEKTKAKGIRKFGLKEKAKSAQRPPPSWPFSPLGPVHPRAPVLHLPLTSGPALSALSLARPCAHASPGRAFARCAPARLCHRPTGPGCQRLPSFNRLPERTACMHTETVVPTSPLHAKPSPRPLESPARAHFPCLVAEPPGLFQLKCLSPALEARPHLNRNNTSVPRI